MSILHGFISKKFNLFLIYSNHEFTYRINLYWLIVKIKKYSQGLNQYIYNSNKDKYQIINWIKIIIKIIYFLIVVIIFPTYFI